MTTTENGRCTSTREDLPEQAGHEFYRGAQKVANNRASSFARTAPVNSMTLPATPLLDELFAAVRAWQPTPPWKRVESIEHNKAAWEAEVNSIITSPALSICSLDFSAEFLRAWFLEVLPKDGGASIYWVLVSDIAVAKPKVALKIALQTERTRT